MYEKSQKLGRGGGARGGSSLTKRNSFPPPPPLHRPPSIPGSRRSITLHKPSPATPFLATSSSQPDESFSLISGDSLSCVAIIRLAPNLVDEIKRIESQGGAARIKFDSNPTNSSANVSLSIFSGCLM